MFTEYVGCSNCFIMQLKRNELDAKFVQIQSRKVDIINCGWSGAFLDCHPCWYCVCVCVCVCVASKMNVHQYVPQARACLVKLFWCIAAGVVLSEALRRRQVRTPKAL